MQINHSGTTKAAHTTKRKMKLSTAATALLLTIIATVDSFTPIPSVKSLQLRQQQQQLNHGESLIVNYNNVGQEDGESEEEEQQKHRFGVNIMGVISGQLYATKVRYYYMTKRGDDILMMLLLCNCRCWI